MLRQGQQVRLYVTGNFATPRHIDFICQTGEFDAIWFDLEHFDISTQDLAMMNLVARAYPVTTIARLRATDYQAVMRTLETGVGGIMCSMVADAAEARQVVQWAKFNNPAPAPGETTGMRGWNGGNIDGNYGKLPAVDYIRHQNQQTMVICQIESEQAVKAVREIAAVPGVDGLFFGPGDYSLCLGVPGQLAHPRVLEAAAAVAEACDQAGKWWGTVAPSVEVYRRVVPLGAKLVCVGGDNRVMNLGVKELVRLFAEARSDAREANGRSPGGPVAKV
jgi:4-hydroxy-2-oxoheptanedioate aldolase